MINNEYYYKCLQKQYNIKINQTLFKFQIFRDKDALASGIIRFGCTNAKCPNDCDTANTEKIKFATGDHTWEPLEIEVKIICPKGLFITYQSILDYDTL